MIINSFNQLTPAQAERLALLSEELGEVQHAIGKILRHGYESKSPFSDCVDTNRDDLAVEIGHVQFAITMMVDSGDLYSDAISQSTHLKAINVVQYLHHQEA